MRKITEGKWIYYPIKDGFVIESKNGSIDNYNIGKVINVNGSFRNEANAKLIAAAPLLLEALQLCLNVLNTENIFGPARIGAEKAIKKALD